jgi:excisionase family DNA binding protein
MLPHHPPAALGDCGKQETTMRQNDNREGLSIPEAVEVAGISRSKLYEFIADGSLIARKAGTKTIILRGDLMAFLASLPRAALVAA